MAIPSGHRPYGNTPGDYVATTATSTATATLTDGSTTNKVIVPSSGELTIYGSRTGAALTDLYDDAGNPISKVPVSASGLIAGFWTASPQVWYPVVGGRARAIPADAGVVQGVTSVASGDITDATTPGKAVLTAPNAAAAREAIGAGVPVTLPTELATGDLSPTGTTTGLASGRRLAAAFSTNAVGFGQKPRLYWDPVAKTWPARTLPAGYTGGVVWDSADPGRSLDPDAPSPSNGTDGDVWRYYEKPAT